MALLFLVNFICICMYPHGWQSIRRSRPGCDQKAGSSARKVRDSRKSEWLKNWIVQPRQRKNGKFDKVRNFTT